VARKCCTPDGPGVEDSNVKGPSGWVFRTLLETGVDVVEQAVSLDGHVAGFLVRVADEFTTTLADPDKLTSSLQGLGLDDASIASVTSFLSARAPDLAKLTGDLPGFLSVIASSSPDLESLVSPVAEAWSTLSSLVDAGPKVSLPALPDGDVLGALFSTSVDSVVRGWSTSVWTGLHGAGFLGHGASILSALNSAISHPFSWVWQTWAALRRQTDLYVSGVLTGPRMYSSSSVELSATEPPMFEVAGGTNVVQRVIAHLAADTYDVPTDIVLEILGTEEAPPRFVAAVFGVGPLAMPGPINFGPALQLSLDPPTEQFAVALTGFGAVKSVGTAAMPSVSISTGSPASFEVGSDGGIHLLLGQPVFDVTIDSGSWSVLFGVTRFELSIPASVAGSLLSIFLPDDGISLRGKLLFRLDAGGFHFDGGVGLSMSWPDVVRLSAVTVHSLVTSLTISGSSFSVTATGTVVIELGALTVTMEGLGISQPLRLTTDGSGNLGIIDLETPWLVAPTGIGVEIDATIVTGGGFLRVGNNEIAGALELSLVLGPLELAIQAFGIIDEINGEMSFVVIMSVEFSPAIEIFLGLTLDAVGGVFGLNRAVDDGALTSLIHSGRATDVLIPEDLVARADEVLDEVAAIFPPRLSQYVVGPILKLGWGRPNSFVTMTVGVLLTFPDPTQIVIIGEFRIAIPEPDLPIIDLQADFDGVIDLTTGDVGFDASLANSRIGLFDVSGDILLRAGPAFGFVFSAGGFHPQFTPPPGLPPLNRLAISLSPSPILSIQADAYFAITGSSLQFGAAVYLEASLGPIGAQGHISLDVLIRTDPKLFFSVVASGGFELTIDGEDVASISLDVLLEGPGQWHARAHASVTVLCVTVSGTIDLNWGSDDPVTLGPPVDVAALVSTALADNSVWTHVLPAVDGGTVQLRPGASGLHPLGFLRVVQSVAPLDVGLAKYGSNSIVSTAPVTVAVTADSAVVTTATELFATSQFFDLSDEERLSKPGFVPFDAGVTVAGTTWQVFDATTVDVVYEESLGPDDPPTGRRFHGMSLADAGWARMGAVGRSHPVAPVSLAQRVGVVDPTYAVVDASSGRTVVGFGPTVVMQVSPKQTIEQIVVADYESQAVMV
jgi:hypothetical protein